MSDIVQDLLVESYENLDRLDRELVGLEKNPHDRDALASVLKFFNRIRTLLGTQNPPGFGPWVSPPLHMWYMLI
jgi:two-component system, chemotaxis family, sensor kinase CheA